MKQSKFNTEAFLIEKIDIYILMPVAGSDSLRNQTKQFIGSRPGEPIIPFLHA